MLSASEKNTKIDTEIDTEIKAVSNFETRAENPLIWPLLTIIKGSQQRCQIHHLATELQLEGLLPDLDKDANKALFKRNFLLMNALYQLQEMLLPEQWLQVQAMDIQLLAEPPADLALMLVQDIALRRYYLDWSHFETNAESIDALFTDFWGRYEDSLGKPEHRLDKAKALQIFELDSGASKQDIRRQWRKLALKWHPDRASGDALKFLQACEAWQVLRE